MANEITKTSDNIEDLFNKVSGLIEQARSYVKTSVNTAEIYTKYYIGKYIVEYEQKGNVRAQYGKQVIKDLSKKLTKRVRDKRLSFFLLCQISDRCILHLGSKQYGWQNGRIVKSK